jgi:hypothetical protein
MPRKLRRPPLCSVHEGAAYIRWWWRLRRDSALFRGGGRDLDLGIWSYLREHGRLQERRRAGRGRGRGTRRHEEGTVAVCFEEAAKRVKVKGSESLQVRLLRVQPYGPQCGGRIHG